MGADEDVKNSLLYKVSKKVYNGELIPPESGNFVSDQNLFNYQAKVLKELAEWESYVYVKGAVALANIFCWAAALLYAQMGAKSVVICPIPYKHSSFPDIPFGMPDFKLFCFQPLKSMLSLMKKDDSPFFRSESCNEAY